MKIQYISDLHLEFLQNIPRIEVVGDILVLAGDVGYPTMPIFWAFMEEQSRRFNHIIYVPGNHEYYHTSTAIKRNRILSMNEIDELIQSEIHRRGLTNIHFLQNSACIIDGVRFIGATLWSPIPLEDKFHIVSAMNDYSVIFMGDRDDAVGLHRLTVDEVNRRFADSSKYIQETLQQQTVKTVVITHHLPSMKMIDVKYAGNKMNAAFASNILHALTVKPDVWICGHSHSPSKKEIEGVSCVMNPVGYPGENKDFNMGQYINI